LPRSSFKYPKTLERYRQILKLYVKPHIGSFRIQKLRAVHLNELYATLLRSGGKNERLLSACTVGHVHRVLHRALGHPATWGVVTQNVAAIVGPPRVASTDQDFDRTTNRRLAAPSGRPHFAPDYRAGIGDERAAEIMQASFANLPGTE
jgi:hypothetical protein